MDSACRVWIKRIQASETKCTRKLLRISYWTHKTNVWVQSKLNFRLGLQEPLHHHHHYQSLNREGRWGTTDDFATSFLLFSPVLHCPLGLAELQACPFPDVVFPPLPLSALSSSPFHCALQDGFGQTWWTGNMTIPLQPASLYIAPSCMCQEAETGTVRARHTPQQPILNHHLRPLGGWATPWSVKEVLDAHNQRVDIPAHARTAHNGPL